MARGILGRAILLGTVVLTGVSTVDAGWLFGRKSAECCPTCQEPPKEKKKSSIGASDPPDGDVVDVIGARFTTARADRVDDTKPKKAAQPPTPVPEVDLDRVEKIENDIRELKNEVRALLTAVKDLDATVKAKP